MKRLKQGGSRLTIIHLNLTFAQLLADKRKDGYSRL